MVSGFSFDGVLVGIEREFDFNGMKKCIFDNGCLFHSSCVVMKQRAVNSRAFLNRVMSPIRGGRINSTKQLLVDQLIHVPHSRFAYTICELTIHQGPMVEIDI